LSSAEEHWSWLRNVVFESYRTGYAMNPSHEGDWNEDRIKETFDMFEPLMKRLYIDAFKHGAKHTVQIDQPYFELITNDEGIITDLIPKDGNASNIEIIKNDKGEVCGIRMFGTGGWVIDGL